MKTKIYSSCILFGLMATSLFAQLDNPSANSVEFGTIDQDTESSSGYELPASKLPSLTTPDHKYNPNKYPQLGQDEPKDFSMDEDDGLLDNKTNKAPKYFTKDKEAKPEYGRDQYLGDLMTGASYVNVVYRDHEYVDGDRIRVFVNGDVVQSDITLDSSFRGFDLNLQPGSNKIDFLALNQGESGPNTAELHVYDDNGILVSAYKWNLLTGNKATVLIVKD